MYYNLSRQVIVFDCVDNGKPFERMGRKAKGPYLIVGSQLPNQGHFLFS